MDFNYKLLREFFRTMEELGKKAGPGIMMPWLKYVGFKGVEMWRNHLDRIKLMFSTVMSEHKETYSEDSPRWKNFLEWRIFIFKISILITK